MIIWGRKKKKEEEEEEEEEDTKIREPRVA
jgi:hypothetical protein